jgi:phosphoribosylformylglycinamidine cyclo-ligase
MATYKESGVDIEKADRFVEYIKGKLKDKGELIGKFAAGLPLKGFKEPVIFSTTDGVGTKLKIAQELNLHDTVGIDLVAMNVNDLITTGARPWFFLDYIATGKLELGVLQRVIDGIIKGCEEAGLILLGGETAEMPGFYPEGVYDLAGFCVGVCERSQVLDGSGIREGDKLIALPSSGFHSNGFSLIRKVLKDRKISLSDYSEELGSTVGEALLTPTRIYVKEISEITGKFKVKAIAHITGGGIPSNLLRVLPKDLDAVVEKDKLPANPVFTWIARLGNIEEEEMFRTFNMGVGMILVIDGDERIPKELTQIGYITAGGGKVLIV